MDMKLDKTKLKQLRESKAWSQSHLAQISGISLRTIQRIEKSGVASKESVKSLCATFDVQIVDLTVETQNPIQQVAINSTPKLAKFKISEVNVKATIISFSIAFIIAFYFVSK